MNADPMEAIRATFFEECAELLENLETGLLKLNEGTQDADTIDAVFRAVHSIKGGAGAFGLSTLVTYAHEFETALDALRSGLIDPDEETVAVLLRGCDRLSDVVAAARTGEAIDLPDTTDLVALSASTQRLDTEIDLLAFQPIRIDLGIGDDAQTSAESPAATTFDAEIDEKTQRAWAIAFEPLPGLLESGNEPLFLFRALEVVGHMNVRAIETDLPTLEDLDPLVPRLRWKIRLDPTAPDLTETEIESVFEFAVDLCVLDIQEVEPEEASVAHEAARKLSSTPDTVSMKNSVPVESFRRGATRTSETDLARGSSAAATGPKPAEASATIRVDLARVDRLINLVGELAIGQSMLAQHLDRIDLDRHSDAIAKLDELQQLTRDTQESVMAIRAQPVRSLFQRMTRIVREASQETGKRVVLITDGEDIEIDKTVVERLAEPLTHMIRNAIDHGIETPEDRIAAGKDAVGTLRLNARQQSDRVVIELSDDGAGVDRERVLAKAVSRGLVDRNAVLDQTEIDQLLFLPGFSTSTTLSSLSGRGVGMNVIQQSIRDLNGTVAIRSETGDGCTILVTLPLTIAILDGMIVRCSGQRLIVPLSSIIETQPIDSVERKAIGSGRTVVRFNGQIVPYLELSACLGIPATGKRMRADDCDTVVLFMQAAEGTIYALRVDGIEAQRQVVIKGLGDSLGQVPCISAATILGDGRVALIIDPSDLAATSGIQNGSGPINTLECMDT